MKSQKFQNMMAIVAVAGMALLASNMLAQDAPAAPASATTMAAPPMNSGTTQVLQLVKANVSDETIISFIKNSSDSYALSADQIIYLRQQGVSSVVLNVMLTQPRPAAAGTTASAAPAPQPTVTSTATVVPTVTYVQTVPTTYYYAPPCYPSYYGYGWGCSPAVSLSFGFGGGWGGGWHGGGHGGHR